MTPVLCLNCGKAFDDHVPDVLRTCAPGASTLWHSPGVTSVEQDTVEAIVKFIVGENYERHGSPAVALYTIDLANRIRSGAWKEKP